MLHIAQKLSALFTFAHLPHFQNGLQTYVTAAASGTEYSGEVTSDLLVTCYSLVVWDTHIACDY